MIIFCVEPTGPPVDVNAVATSSTSIHTWWNPPSVLKWNGVISGYIVQIIHIPSSAVQEFKYSYEQYNQECYINGNGLDISMQYIFKDRDFIKSLLLFLLLGLEPYSEYVISVAAFSDFGVGNFSNNITVQTMEDGILYCLVVVICDW